MFETMGGILIKDKYNLTDKFKALFPADVRGRGRAGEPVKVER